MIDYILNFASSKAEAIGRVIGRSPADVKKAIERGKRMLPEVSNATDGGISILQRAGIDKGFIQEMRQKYGKFASKVPGLSQYLSHLDRIEKELGAVNVINRKSDTAKTSGFDKNKYKKV